MTNNPAFVSVPREVLETIQKALAECSGYITSPLQLSNEDAERTRVNGIICHANSAIVTITAALAAAPSAPVVSGEEELRKALEEARELLHLFARDAVQTDHPQRGLKAVGVIARIDLALKQGGDRG